MARHGSLGPKSQFGVAVSEGLRRSAEARKCPECGRHGALVEVTEYAEFVFGVVPYRHGTVCRWARDSDGRLCSWPGAWGARLT
jgi:hypothetical protein